MYKNLATFVSALPDDALGAVPLEDVALCAAWYDSFRGDSEVQERHADLRQALDRWVRLAVPLDLDTEGVRQQPLLRELLKEIGAGRLKRLAREELDFLYFAWGLGHRTKKESILGRAQGCLEPHFAELEERRDGLELEPGLPGLAKRLAVILSEELKSASVRDVRIFGGIDLPRRGPVFTHKGNLKIVGNIEEDCSVVVENGSCYVRGMVLGVLAATESCEIQDNISGAVIARRGNVRARNILDQATVISKEGGVACRDAQRPKIIFGCKEVLVRGEAIDGNYLGRNIKLGKEIVGGEIQVSGCVEAGRFLNGEQSGLAIILRRGLTCRDYGEILSLESNRLLTNALKLHKRLLNLHELKRLAETEADDYAGNVLLFLLGSADTTEHVEKIQKLRRRRGYVDRLHACAHSLVASVEDQFAMGFGLPHATQSVKTPFGDEVHAMLRDLQRELSLLAAEGKADKDMHEFQEAVLGLGREMLRKMICHNDLQSILNRLLDTEEKLDKERNAVERVVDGETELLERTMERRSIIDRAKEACALVEVLEQLVNAARKRSGNSVFVKRVTNRYVLFMRRTVEGRVNRVAEYENSILEIEKGVAKIREKLWDEFHVSLPEYILEGGTFDDTCATGRFDEGVRICSWRHLLEDLGAKHSGLVSTPDSEDQNITYRRNSYGAIELC